MSKAALTLTYHFCNYKAVWENFIGFIFFLEIIIDAKPPLNLRWDSDSGGLIGSVAEIRSFSNILWHICMSALLSLYSLSFLWKSYIHNISWPKKGSFHSTLLIFRFHSDIGQRIFVQYLYRHIVHPLWLIITIFLLYVSYSALIAFMRRSGDIFLPKALGA